MLGPVIGGALTDGDLFGLGWRAIFLVNVPLGLLAFAGSVEAPAGVQGRQPARRSTSSAPCSSSLAAGLLIYPLIQGREAGWPAWTFLSIGASLVVARRVRAARAQRSAGVSPLVTMSLFRKRAFSAGLATALVFFAGMIGVMLVFSLYLQLGQGFSAIGTPAWR